MSKLHYKDSPSEGERKAFAKYLAEDEELILVAGLGKIYLRSCFITGLLWPGGIFLILTLGLAYLLKYNLVYGLILGLGLSSLVSFLKTLHVYHATRYLLTTRRVIIKHGVFAVKIASALFDKITHIEVEQSFFDKLLYKHGTIIVNTAGTNKGEITLNYVDYPIEFKNILERLINREREQFGARAINLQTVEGEVVS